jgi:hypothetical protein
MRSDLIFQASVHVSNRYQLTRLVSMATRALHRPGTRIQDTMNDVLTRFGQANPIAYAPHDHESADVRFRRRKPRQSSSREAALGNDRTVGDRVVQASARAARSSFSSFDSSALPPGVLFTTVNPMLSGQQVEGMR